MADEWVPHPTGGPLDEHHRPTHISPHGKCGPCESSVGFHPLTDEPRHEPTVEEFRVAALRVKTEIERPRPEAQLVVSRVAGGLFTAGEECASLQDIEAAVNKVDATITSAYIKSTLDHAMYWGWVSEGYRREEPSWPFK